LSDEPRPADDAPTYGSYLELDALLALQQPRSTPEHSDELLFIIVHQSSELWFKAIIHDLDGLVDALDAREPGQALWRMQRVNTLMRIVAAQLTSLESLPPQHFAQFRSYLGTSSGAQSKQFRAIETRSETIEEHFLALLDASHVHVDELYLGPGPTVLFFLAEALLEYEQLFAQWRFTHVQVVERVIGPATGGSGGSLGSRYLKGTIDQRYFPKLWEVRGKFFGTSAPAR
jgi:tryptophan 2,3-dioxygenase